MTVHFDAHFENGVLVPDEEVNLPVNRKLRVTVDEEPAKLPQSVGPRFDDPSDPMPEGGVELVDWWARHRIVIDPKIAREIAESPEYLDQEVEDGA